jgi:hypothetical protein
MAVRRMVFSCPIGLIAMDPAPKLTVPLQRCRLCNPVNAFQHEMN